MELFYQEFINNIPFKYFYLKKKIYIEKMFFFANYE